MRFDKGFTLIEVIITIIIMSIAAAAFINFVGRGFTRSAIPAGQVASQYILVQQMEEITSEYRKALEAGTLNLTTLGEYAKTKKYLSVSNIQLTGGSYTTQSTLLQVILKDGDQTLLAIFTQ